jgi:hypothetical protein
VRTLLRSSILGKLSTVVRVPTNRLATALADTRGSIAETFLIAIDVGKAFDAILIEGPDGQRQPFRIANSAEEYDRLVGSCAPCQGGPASPWSRPATGTARWPPAAPGGVLGQVLLTFPATDVIQCR